MTAPFWSKILEIYSQITMHSIATLVNLKVQTIFHFLMLLSFHEDFLKFLNSQPNGSNWNQRLRPKKFRRTRRRRRRWVEQESQCAYACVRKYWRALVWQNFNIKTKNQTIQYSNNLNFWPSWPEIRAQNAPKTEKFPKSLKIELRVR